MCGRPATSSKPGIVSASRSPVPISRALIATPKPENAVARPAGSSRRCSASFTTSYGRRTSCSLLFRAERRKNMGIFRLYTGSDGQSHIEDQALNSHPALTTPQTTAHIVFGQLPVGTFIDWHPAPRRQYVIILAGQLDIGLGDSTLRGFVPGDGSLVQNPSVHVHTTPVVVLKPQLTAII